MYITNPAHGGKVTCHKCGGFIEEDEAVAYRNVDKPIVLFHKECFNVYEHYYGLNRPID